VNNNDDCYCLIVVDFAKKQLYYINPKCEDVDIVTDRAKEVCVLLNRFLDYHIQGEDDLRSSGWWEVANGIEKIYFSQAFDSAMFVFLLMYFSVFKCPVVFDHDEIICMRKQLTYWICRCDIYVVCWCCVCKINY
jgi:hypothetical protein